MGPRVEYIFHMWNSSSSIGKCGFEVSGKHLAPADSVLHGGLLNAINKREVEEGDSSSGQRTLRKLEGV